MKAVYHNSIWVWKTPKHGPKLVPSGVFYQCHSLVLGCLPESRKVRFLRAFNYFETMGISWINCNCTSECVGVAQWWGSVRCCSFSSHSQDVTNKMEPAKQHEAKLQVVILTLHAFFSVILSSCLENSNTLCKTCLPQDIKFWESATLQTIKTSNHTSPYIIKSQ